MALRNPPPGARGQPRSPQPSPTTLPAPRYLESSSPSLRCVARSSSSRARRARASPAPRPQCPGHGTGVARQQPSAGGLLMAAAGGEGTGDPRHNAQSSGWPPRRRSSSLASSRRPQDLRSHVEGQRVDGARDTGLETRGQPLHRHRSQAEASRVPAAFPQHPDLHRAPGHAARPRCLPRAQPRPHRFSGDGGAAVPTGAAGAQGTATGGPGRKLAIGRWR